MKRSLFLSVILLLTATLLQIFGLSRLTVFGVSPDLVTVFLAVVSVFSGQRVGMSFGFIAGLLADLLSGNVGMNMLFRTIEGFTAGYFHLPENSHATLSYRSRMLYFAIISATFAGNLVFSLSGDPLGETLLFRIFVSGGLACLMNLLIGVAVNRLYLRKYLSE